MEELKEALKQQLSLLYERSKKCDDVTGLCQLTHGICQISKELDRITRLH